MIEEAAAAVEVAAISGVVDHLYYPKHLTAFSN
jgi:hypothetical protein